jgi:hypothetical protein
MEVTTVKDQYNCLYGVVHNANGPGACAVSTTRGPEDLLEKMRRIAKEEWDGVPLDERLFGGRRRV